MTLHSAGGPAQPSSWALIPRYVLCRRGMCGFAEGTVLRHDRSTTRAPRSSHTHLITLPSSPTSPSSPCRSPSVRCVQRNLLQGAGRSGALDPRWVLRHQPCGELALKGYEREGELAHGPPPHAHCRSSVMGPFPLAAPAKCQLVHARLPGLQGTGGGSGSGPGPSFVQAIPKGPAVKCEHTIPLGFSLGYGRGE